jgi:hypothetical protein
MPERFQMLENFRHHLPESLREDESKWVTKLLYEEIEASMGSDPEAASRIGYTEEDCKVWVLNVLKFMQGGLCASC